MPTTAQPRSIFWKPALCYWKVSQTAAQGLGKEKKDSLFFQPLWLVLWEQVLMWQQKPQPLLTAITSVIMTQETASQLIRIVSFGAVLGRNTWKCSPCNIILCITNWSHSNGLIFSPRIWQDWAVWQSDKNRLRERDWSVYYDSQKHCQTEVNSIIHLCLANKAFFVALW